MQEKSQVDSTTVQSYQKVEGADVSAEDTNVFVKKKSTWKKKLVTFGLLVVLAIGGYGYYQFTLLQQWYADAQFAIANQENAEASQAAYLDLRLEIDEETDRCKDFVASEAGEFGEFEYCNRFIKWSNEAAFLDDIKNGLENSPGF